MRNPIWRIADQIRTRYQAVAHAGCRAGPGEGPLNAVRAEVYREVLDLLLTEALGRPVTRLEVARWLAGQTLPEPTPPPDRVLRQPALVAPDPEAEGHSAPRRPFQKAASLAVTTAWPVADEARVALP